MSGENEELFGELHAKWEDGRESLKESRKIAIKLLSLSELKLGLNLKPLWRYSYYDIRNYNSSKTGGDGCSRKTSNDIELVLRQP